MPSGMPILKKRRIFFSSVTGLLCSAFLYQEPEVWFRGLARKAAIMSEFAPKQILCPVDLGPASSVVLSWARLLAERFAAKVDVIHADWTETPRYFTGEQLGTLEAEAASRRLALETDLRDFTRKVLGARIAFSVSVVEGHAVDVVLRRLTQNPPDLVIMGTHGRGGVARILLGSVAENVVHETHCPTLIVRGPEIPSGVDHLQRVLCPVNLTDATRDCIQTASGIAVALGAELGVLQAIDDGIAEEEVTRQILCERVPESIRRHCRVSEVVLKGDPAEQIILFARREKTDLIVLGAEPRSFLEFSILGRTTERVLRHGPSSVLLLPLAATRAEAASGRLAR